MKMRTIYLSAHLDDAVLSCGGLIHDQVSKGRDVEIWTFFCAIPPDKPISNYTKRMDEDIRAIILLGAAPIHYCQLDAFGRGYTSAWSSVEEWDEAFILSLSRIIEQELQPNDKLMCPLAVGNHVDHVVLRRAAEALDIPLTYYVDFPYIDYQPEKLDEAVIGLVKHAETISPEGLSYWTKAVSEYVSQDLYATQDITREKITEYWAHINGVFLWERQTHMQTFTKVYYENLWKNGQTVSGPGSTLIETETLRKVLPEIVKKHEILSVLDFPCGDFFWMRLVDWDIEYTGADIVWDLIRMNQFHYGGYKRRTFILADIVEGIIPTAHLLFCRDCLGHFSQHDVQKAIENIKKSSCVYLMTTTFPEVRGDWDAHTGGWRPINLRVSPYNFPEPLELIDEKVFTNYGMKAMGLWKIKDLP